jgi:hypothetical protein
MATACKVTPSQSVRTLNGDPQVIKILDRAFEKAGGWDRWTQLSTISYKKKSVLYKEDGSVESDITQFHEYNLQPELSGTIFWKDAKGSHSILYKDSKAQRFLNGALVAGQDEEAYKTFMSAYYVLFIPFKLSDDHTTLGYEGVDTLQTGEVVDVIKASYSPELHDNHSTDDTWYYYFEQSTGHYIGSMVYHAPTYAYIRNSAVNRELPLVMNTYRESYRVDADRNIQFLRGEFFYNDYQMTFK